MSADSSDDLLARARQGDREALGELLERFRDPLRATARAELSSRLQVRVDPSDIVQNTFFEAQRDLHQFQGEQLPQFQAWLRQILKHTIQETVQQHKLAQKRSIVREAPPNDDFGPRDLEADQSSPSQNMHRQERAARLLQAMSALPPDQQHALRLRFFEALDLAQISDMMDRSKPAVAGLLKRGMRTLRQNFSTEQGGGE